MNASIGISNPKIDPNEPSPQEVWIKNGAIPTMISYAEMNGLPKQDVAAMNLHRIKNLLPNYHIHFLKNLYSFYETDKYIFVHAGCDPNIPISEQSNDILLWDRDLYKYVIKNKNDNFHWKKTIVCGHNSKGPFIHPKFFMLDMSYKKKIMCAELNSMTAFVATPRKKSMLFMDLKKVMAY